MNLSFAHNCVCEKVKRNLRKMIRSTYWQSCTMHFENNIKIMSMMLRFVINHRYFWYFRFRVWHYLLHIILFWLSMKSFTQLMSETFTWDSLSMKLIHQVLFRYKLKYGIWENGLLKKLMHEHALLLNISHTSPAHYLYHNTWLILLRIAFLALLY